MKKTCIIMVAFCLAVVGQVAASLVPIPLVNPGFEAGIPGPGEEIPGWPSPGTGSDAGVDTGGHSGEYSAFLKSGTVPSAGAIYQVTDYTIQEGDVFTLRFWSTIVWENAEITADLFYGNEANPAYVLDSAANVPPGGWFTDIWTEFELTASATPESVGQKLGVHFVNTGLPDGSWLKLDDVSLSVVPEPATFTLLGLGVLFLLHKRKLTD